MARPRFSVFIAMSVDGLIARRDGSLDWLDTMQRPDEDYGYKAFVDAVDTIVMGRRTYETALRLGWPHAGKRCVVLTHGPLVPRHGERAFAGDPESLARDLEDEGARRVYVDGGAVVRAFLDAGLIDDLTLSVIPVVLGSGIALFGDGLRERRLVLEGSTSFPSGLVQLRYRVA
jgi:dihydrofolate reductase